MHRWLGVGLCALFLLWFASGVGMMYWDFPAVTPGDRLERAASLDPATIRVSPEEALAALEADRAPAGIRLNTFDGRPVYRFRIGREDTLVYADTGEPPGIVSRALMDRVASAWTGRPLDAARVEATSAVDQWTVQGPLRTLRPMWKYSWPNGEQVYVAQRTGEV